MITLTLPERTTIQNKADNLRRLVDAKITGPAYEAALWDATDSFREYQQNLKTLEATYEAIEGVLKTQEPFDVFYIATLDKVTLSEGAIQTEISNAVVEELTFGDLKKIVKVTETALTELGRPDLITKYKRTLPNRKARSLKWSPVNAKEKALLLEGKSLK